MGRKKQFCIVDIKECSDYISTKEFTDYVTLSRICHEVCKDYSLSEEMFSKLLDRCEYLRIYEQRKDRDAEYMEIRNDILQRYMSKKNAWIDCNEINT